jgi:hypothetical protein
VSAPSRWATAGAVVLALLPAALLSWYVLDQDEAAAPPAAGGTLPVIAQGQPTDQPNGRFFASGPQFAVDCGLAGQARLDPILHPGEEDAGHLHDFFGSEAVGPDAIGPDLVGTETTCRVQADTAAYWAPSLLRDGAPVIPTGVSAYYRVGPGIDPLEVEPYPLGLAAIAGDGDAEGPQPASVVGFGCGRATVVAQLDAPDHRSHLRYSGTEGCPASHPVAVPRLTLVIHYPIAGAPGALELASGPLHTAHADFLNGWEPEALDLEVRSCLHREVVCAIPDPARPGG